MTFAPGQSGNPSGRVKERPFRTALDMEIKAAGENHKSLRKIAKKLLQQAEKGEPWAIKEIADRLDGKPAQAVTVGGDADNPLELTVTSVMERINGQSRALPNGRTDHQPVGGPEMEAEQPLHDHRQEGE